MFSIMLAHEFYLSIEEREVVEELYARIPYTILKRGDNYYRQGLVSEVNKQDGSLNAVVQGTYAYTTVIDLEEEDYDCSCPADLPCKHIAALVIWAIREENKISQRAPIRQIDFEPNSCDIAFVIKYNLRFVNVFAYNEDTKFFRISNLNQFNFLKENWQAALEEYLQLQNRDEAKIDHYGELPFFSLKHLIKNFKSDKPIRFFQSLTSLL